MKVLVVDTDPDVRHLLEVRLTRAQYDVHLAETAEHAHEIVSLPQRPHIVVSEVLLPGMDGIEFTQRLKQLPDAPIVILLSALNTDDHIHRGLTAGADDYVTKPFSPIVMLERLRVNLIRSGRTTPAMPDVVEDDND